MSGIVESNPGKFRLGENELQERRAFVEMTRQAVQVRVCTIVQESMKILALDRVPTVMKVLEKF